MKNLDQNAVTFNLPPLFHFSPHPRRWSGRCATRALVRCQCQARDGAHSQNMLLDVHAHSCVNHRAVLAVSRGTAIAVSVPGQCI